MLCSCSLTPLQANGGKQLVCAPKVYVPSEQRLCGKPGRRRPILGCWVEVVGLEEFAGEGVWQKNRGACGAHDDQRFVKII
jgi:hypothetical protein